jgi:hypothetical protein
MCWGHNVGAQAQCRSTINLWGIINLWGYNQFVGAQSICGTQSICGGIINLFCGGTACRAPTLLPSIAAIYCCHLLPSHALPCPAPTMLPATVPPCYHAMTPPHALPLPSHATATICCHLLLPMPSHALPYHAAVHHTTTMPPCYHAMTHHMLCPQIQETHTMVGAQWWRHNRGHNVGAQCGHTVGIQW